MRQTIYSSDSLIGSDLRALDRIMVQARTNNAMDDISGLLWTNGLRFAQVVEGPEDAISDLMLRLRADPRHSNVEIAQDITTAEREYGDWSMMRPTSDPLAKTYENRMLKGLAALTTSLGADLREIIIGSLPQVA